MNGETIRTITIRGQSEGLDKLTADINKLVTAEQSLAIVSEDAGKKHLSLEAQWKRQTMRLDEVARAQANVARETKLAKQALDQNLTDQAGYARQLELINQRYATTAQGAQNYGKAMQQSTSETRLARHELINLSRQFQDVGVGLASGQSPLTVLVQQGTQIADVFATSSGTIRGFFSQIGTGAARFLTSATGIATGVAGIGAALLSLGSSYASGQREIQKGLSGIGAASGVTRDQINAIAEATASWSGASVSQAREAATAFAATGNILAATVGQATKLIDAYVRAGADATEVTKALAAALQDPAKAALEYNKSLAFLNVAMLQNIRNLQAQGKEQEAMKVLMTGMLPAIEEQAKTVSFWGRAWNVAGNLASAAADKSGKAIARMLEAGTGADFGGYSDEERRESARERVSSLQERISGPRSAMQAVVPQSVLDSWNASLKAAQEELARLEQATDKGAAALARLVGQAQTAADGFMPLQAQIRQTQQDLAKLREAEAAGVFVDPAAIAAGQIRLQQLREQEGVIARQNQYTQQLAAQYPGMTIEGAKQLNQANLQLAITQARTPAELATAQAIAQQAQLLAAGVPPAEALLIIARQRGVTEAQIEETIARQNAKALHNAQTTVEVKKTTSDIEQNIRKIPGVIDAGTDATQEFGNEIRNNTVNLQQFNNVLRDTAAWADKVHAFLGPSLAAEIENRLSEIDFGSSKQYESMTTFGQEMELQAAINKKLYGEGNYDVVTGLAGDIPVTTVQPKQNLSDRLAREREELISSFKDLTSSTDSLNATMQNALSPFYSQDPRTTKLGFRAGTVGNPDWMTGAGNANPLVAVLGAGATAPGMANGGSFVVGGGYSANDNRMAVFPVASGEQVMVNRNPQGRGGQVVNIDNRIIVTGTVDVDALSKMKVSRFQQAQRMRGQLARA